MDGAATAATGATTTGATGATTLIITAAASDMGSWGYKKNGMAQDTDEGNVGQISTCNNIWCAAP